MSIPLGGGGAAKGTGDFELCPTGAQQLVCCDVIDLGKIKVRGFGNKGDVLQHKVVFRWQSEKKMADGRPYLIQRRFTLSSHKKAALRAFLEAWRGKDFTDDQARDFDTEKLIGVNCWSNVIHRTTPRGIFAEVQTVMPPLPDRKCAVDGYVRVKDRPPEPGAAAATDPPPDDGDEPAAPAEPPTTF